jgi:peptidoglycan/LPS O-acetylase OafA/YrhL
MSQRIQSTKNKKRPWLTYAWIFGLAALVFVLIYKEWTEYLYVLATLGVTALLIIVATADLGVGDASSGSALPDPQAAGSGVSSSVRKTSRK